MDNRKILTQYYDLEFTKSVIKKSLELGSEKIVKIITESELLGRGGAYFPTGLKWSSVLQQQSKQKYIICNAEEGEPATFKDKFLLKYLPYKILDGMIIASIAVCATKGIIYINEKYKNEKKKIEDLIRIYHKKNFLGNNILGTDHNFSIEIIESNGRYITGEETALLNVIEGQRPQPRLKPPYPTQKGLFNLPTVINNVETLCFVPQIIFHGPKWFKSYGVDGSYGTKLICLTVDDTPYGVWEIEFGKLTIKDILTEYGKIKNLKNISCVLPSATSEVLFPDRFSLKYDIKSFKKQNISIGTGGIIVCSKSYDVIKKLTELIKFFMEESCGYCVPCRIGTKRLYEKLQEILLFQTAKPNKSEFKKKLLGLEELILTLNLTSRCLLGKSCVNPIKSLIAYIKNSKKLTL